MSSSENVLPTYTRTQERQQYAEYSHLLRSIRTQVIGDVSMHLIAAANSPPSQPPKAPNKATAVSKAGPSKAKTDTVTRSRWPLMAGEIQRPIYSLQDEVQRIARQHTSRSEEEESSAPQSVDRGGSELNMQVDPGNLPGDTPALSDTALALRTGALLEHMLDLLKANRQVARPSVTVRLKPMGWETIIKLLATSGAVDSSVLERAVCRLEAIYGKGDSLAPHRTKRRKTSKPDLTLSNDMNPLLFRGGGLDGLINYQRTPSGVVQRAYKPDGEQTHSPGSDLDYVDDSGAMMD